MLALQRPYIRVLRDGRSSYGGNQMWSASSNIQKCGCGPVAALDVLLYLSGRQEEPIHLTDYDQELERLCRYYFPLIPSVGINGIFLAMGMERLLRKYRLPYHAFWAVSGKRFWTRITEMLEQDIPAIFSIGPNFPLVWGKNKLRFYVKGRDGSMIPAQSTLAHYVTATGLDGDWLRISSWGREYYIRRQEYDDYVRTHSASLVSNVLMIRKAH